MVAGAGADIASASFTLSDGTDSVSGLVGRRSGEFADTVSDAMSGLSYAAEDGFGQAVARQGALLAIGVPRDDTGGTNRGAVHIITDSDGDGDWSDAGSGDIVTLSSDTTGLTLPDYENFGHSVAFGDGVLAVGAPVYSNSKGRVYVD